MVRVRDLADRDPARWWTATHHPFLDGARAGALPASAFDRWLEQDRMFVETLARAWAQVLTEAPTGDLLLADGINAFVAEMDWLEHVATGRGLAISAVPLPAAAAAYRAHLGARPASPIRSRWRPCGRWRTTTSRRGAPLSPGASAYRVFVEHRTDDTFAAFVARLEAAADRASPRRPPRRSKPPSTASSPRRATRPPSGR